MTEYDVKTLIAEALLDDMRVYVSSRRDMDGQYVEVELYYQEWLMSTDKTHL